MTTAFKPNKIALLKSYIDLKMVAYSALFCEQVNKKVLKDLSKEILLSANHLKEISKALGPEIMVYADGAFEVESKKDFTAINSDWLRTAMDITGVRTNQLALGVNVAASKVSGWLGGAEMSGPTKAAVYYFFKYHSHFRL